MSQQKVPRRFGGLTIIQTMTILAILGVALFFALSLSPLRAWLIDAIPLPLKLGIAAGIGLFLALIAMKNAGIVVAHPATLITHGDLTSWPVAMAVLGFALTVALEYRRVMGGIIIIPPPPYTATGGGAGAGAGAGTGAGDGVRARRRAASACSTVGSRPT